MNSSQGQADLKGEQTLSELIGADSDSAKSKDLILLKKKLGKIMSAIDNLESMEVDQNRGEQERMKDFKEKMLESLEDQIHSARENLHSEVSNAFKLFDNKLSETLSEIKDMKISLNGETLDNTKKPKLYSEKTFSHHDSLLTVLFRSKEEFKTLYHIALASMILLMCNLVFHDYTEYGTFIDYETFVWCFLNYDVVIKAWFILIAYSLGIILIVQLIQKFNLGRKIWIPMYVTFWLGFYVYATFVSDRFELNFGSAMIILCESTRVSFKVHSYFRNKLLYGMPNDYANYLPEDAKKRGITVDDLNKPKITISDFKTECGRFLYFMFCPTLVYRDEYPKRSNRNLNFILFNGFNCALSIYYVFILFKTFMKPEFADSGEKPGTLGSLMISIFKSILPGSFCMFLLFYGMLHSWFNFWAEILRFPDRLFYEDWWNSLEFGTYYRKWNIVVHEWLYYYVYMDLLKFTKGKLSRNNCQLMTFLISAVIHEWILTYAIGFFYPMLFIIFTGPGIILIRNSRNHKSKQLNIMFWILLFFGTGLLMVLYSREYYARAKVNFATVEKQYGWLGANMPRFLYILLQQS